MRLALTVLLAAVMISPPPRTESRPSGIFVARREDVPKVVVVLVDSSCIIGMGRVGEPELRAFLAVPGELS